MLDFETLPDRIKAKLRIDEETGCWLWTGRWTTGNGYGKVSWQGKHRVAHRIVYGLLVCIETANDPTKQLDHTCRNRGCCNPSHLEPVSPQENTRRGNAVLFGQVAPLEA